MRAKSEIISTLAANLTSDIWKKLKNSLLGRELIALGAEIISENENVKDTLLLQLNIETADKYGLFLLSQMNEIPVTSVKPNTIEVLMLSNTKTYAPYTLVYNVGNVSFTNIEYTLQNKTINLICGIHKCYIQGNNITLPSGAVSDGETTFFFDGENTYSGIKLGNAYPDSIIVTNGEGIEIPRYASNIAMANNIDIMYKVVTGLDGTQYIRFVCNNNTNEPTDFKIEWLDHNVNDVDIDNMFVTVNNTTVGEIKYVSEGNANDLDFMRNQLKKGMAVTNGLNTPRSIERYVNGFPFVVDSRCVVNPNGGISVYIKPSSQNNDFNIHLDFSEIAAHIAYNTILYPNIKVRTGKQLLFDIQISGINDELLKNEIKSMIQNEFAFDSMKFNTYINTSKILNDIYSKFNVLPNINMVLTEEFTNGGTLSGVPFAGSLQGFDNNNNLSVWENNNILYGNLKTTQIPFGILDVEGAIGTMFILKQSPLNIVDAIGANDVVDNVETEVIKLDSNVVVTDSTSALSADVDSEGIETNVLSYETEVKIATDKKNRFYIYDVLTNSIKPFDDDLISLINKTQNPSLLRTSWHTPDVNFSNLYDMRIVSANDGLFMKFVFKSFGAEPDTLISSEDNTYTLKYWNINNLQNFDYFRDGVNVDEENENAYKGKYQMLIGVSNSLSLLNINTSGWEYYDTLEGNSNVNNGFYNGLSNYDDTGAAMNMLSNTFIYENQMYYFSSIRDNFVIVKNHRTNNEFGVQLSSALKGMIAIDDVLYVIQQNNITEVKGFNGIRQKTVTYMIYLNLNEHISIKQIAKGFNDYFVFSTTDNKYYVANGFEMISESKLGFKNLREMFTDIDTQDCIVGSCTGEYATLYKIVSEDNKTGFVFYCGNILTGVTTKYEKIATQKSSNEGAEDNTYVKVIKEKTIYPYVNAYGSKEEGDYYEDDISDYGSEVVNADGTFDYNITTSTYTHRKSNNAVMAVSNIVYATENINAQVGDINLFLNKTSTTNTYNEDCVMSNAKIGLYDSTSNSLKLDVINNISKIKYTCAKVNKMDDTYMVLNNIDFV